MSRIALTAAMILSSAAAYANGIQPAPVPLAPVSVAPAIMDWSGAYAGVSVGQWTGEYTPVPTFGVDLEDISIVGGHIGYALQSGALVYGAEIAFSALDQDIAFATSFPGDNRITGMVDVSGRFGYAAGPVLIYGLLGASFGTFDLLTVGGQTSTDMTGLHVGLGADYRVSDRFSIGASYVQRWFEEIDYFSPFNAPIDEITSQTLSLRATYHF